MDSRRAKNGRHRKELIARIGLRAFDPLEGFPQPSGSPQRIDGVEAGVSGEAAPWITLQKKLIAFNCPARIPEPLVTMANLIKSLFAKVCLWKLVGELFIPLDRRAEVILEEVTTSKLKECFRPGRACRIVTEQRLPVATRLLEITVELIDPGPLQSCLFAQLWRWRVVPGLDPVESANRAEGRLVHILQSLWRLCPAAGPAAYKYCIKCRRGVFDQPGAGLRLSNSGQTLSSGDAKSSQCLDRRRVLAGIRITVTQTPCELITSQKSRMLDEEPSQIRLLIGHPAFTSCNSGKTAKRETGENGTPIDNLTVKGARFRVRCPPLEQPPEQIIDISPGKYCRRPSPKLTRQPLCHRRVSLLHRQPDRLRRHTTPHRLRANGPARRQQQCHQQQHPIS